ncbi:NAD(P)H-binding protein [Actinokineospora sp. HUAS TT18]|uniref:NAD(P)H-binding protein n=1 Tax=Actinokineospora sp. HUAS TT18 TaxID=3447451 RepID=UPI003F520ACF
MTSVTVYGASGHTGRFIVSELRERGLTPILSGRDPEKLALIDGEARPASLDDPAALDRALAGSAAVINAAGPFAVTTLPVLEAAMRAGIPYLDVAAELEAVVDTYAQHSRAVAAGIPVVPSMAFFGGLGDLLTTAALGDWDTADETDVAYWLSSWHPTNGTRASGRVSGQRRDGRRPVVTNGELVLRETPAPQTEWTFPAPIGRVPVQSEFTMADSVVIAQHRAIPVTRSYMATNAVADLSGTTAPTPTDARGRSDQSFLIDVKAHRNREERRITATGRDIYAISAPLVAEATERVIGTTRSGVLPPSTIFDAWDFLGSIKDLTVS